MKSKPRILLVPDSPNWAFDNRARELQKNLSQYYLLDKKYYDELTRKKTNATYFDKYDCVFIFYWKHRGGLNVDIPKEKLATGIFSYGSWRSNKKGIDKELEKYKAIIIADKRMADHFDQRKYKLFYAPHGVNEKKFYPLKKILVNKDKLIVGWAGHPDHFNSTYKGYWNIIVPVAKKNSDWLELKSAIRHKNPIPHSKMNQFYNSVDVLLCASKGDTGPNTVLEAAACGKAVVSTPVGIVPELIKNNYNGIIIKRNQKSLTAALKKLHNNRKLLKLMGQRNRKEILRNWTYKKRSLNYKKAFDFVINSQK